MCRPQGNTNQDYEISLQNIKDIFKTPVKPKNPENKSVDKDWRNQKPTAAVANSTTVYTKKLNVEYWYENSTDDNSTHNSTYEYIYKRTENRVCIR